MAKERPFADVLQEIYDGKKNGALFVDIYESSEDLMRFYFKNGEIYYLTYGSAVGQDCIDIIEYYTLRNATYFDGVLAPEGSVHAKFPTKKFIEAIRKTYKKVRVP